MRKLHIGVDIDGVICNLIADVLKQIRYSYSFKLRKIDIYKHEINEILGLSSHSFFHVFDAALSKTNHPMIKEASHYINKLRHKHNICIVTARPCKYNSLTRKWLKINRIEYNKLINVNKNKHERLQEMDIFIDDDLHEIISASSIKHLKLILYNQPWNKSYNIKGLFKRVNNWKQVFLYINKIVKE